MFRTIPQKYSLYDPVYGGVFPMDQYFVILFDTIPSSFEPSQFFDVEFCQYLSNNGFVCEAINNIYHRRKSEDDYEYMYVNMSKQIFVKVFSIKSGSKINWKVSFKYNCKKGQLKQQINWTEVEKFYKLKKKSNISLIKQEHGMLDTEDYDLTIPEMDLALNYGETFINIHDKIVNRLNKDHDKGIILLHGDPGGGKNFLCKIPIKPD